MADSQKAERLDRELQFQRSQAEQVASVTATSGSILARYRHNRHWRIFPKEFIYHSIGDFRGKRILDYGCGTGEITSQLALLGATVSGFDVSPELVAIARQRAELDGVSDRVDLFVGDGEEVILPRNHFDYVIAYALLHHTDYVPVVERIVNALKPGGRAFIAEPVTFSRLLSGVRDRLPVPKHVSPDERQLTIADINAIRSKFSHSDVVYFNALGRLQRFFRGQPPSRHGRAARAATIGVHYADRLLFAFPGAWRAAGSVVVIADK